MQRMTFSSKHWPSMAAAGLVASFVMASAFIANAQTTRPDPAAGRAVYARCQACHSLTPGRNQMGPSLAGVVGRKAGIVQGYAYSPALKNGKIVWNAATLDRFLTKPSAVAPGTKMMFVGIPAAKDRADVIAYLLSGGK